MKKRWNPQVRSRELLMMCQRHLEEYTVHLTMRQLFYLLVSDGLLANEDSGWRKLRALTVKARKNDRLPRGSFPTENFPTKNVYNTDVEEYLDGIASKYEISRMSNQPNHIEVWVERRPINLFVEHIIGSFGIPVYVTSGHANYSFAHAAAERIKDSLWREGSPRILYLSDFSTSSHKMFNSLKKELAEELEISEEEMSAILFKVAVKPEHIAKHNLEASYAKAKEPKDESFEELYGGILEVLGLPDNVNIEIESMNPRDLAKIITNSVYGLLDMDCLMETAKLEHENKEIIKERLRQDGE